MVTMWGVVPEVRIVKMWWFGCTGSGNGTDVGSCTGSEISKIFGSYIPEVRMVKMREVAPEVGMVQMWGVVPEVRMF